MADEEKEGRRQDNIWRPYLEDSSNEVPETSQASTPQGTNSGSLDHRPVNNTSSSGATKESASKDAAQEVSASLGIGFRVPAGSGSVQHCPGDGATSSYVSEQPAITGSSLFTIPTSCSGGFYFIASTSSAVLEDTMRPHDTGPNAQLPPPETPEAARALLATTGGSSHTSVLGTSSAPIQQQNASHPEGIGEASNQQHGSKADEESGYECRFCEETFRCAEDFRKHVSENIANGKHLCRVCGLWVLFPSVFQKHCRRHKGEKPFSCDRCGVKYMSKESLTRHINQRHPRDPERDTGDAK